MYSRLTDPGTMRSLIWIAMGVIGLPQTDMIVDTVAGVVAIILGGISAAMKPKNVVIAPPASSVTVETPRR